MDSQSPGLTEALAALRALERLLFGMDVSGRRREQWRWRYMRWWRHQMETFSALLAPCVGNSLVTREFPAQRQVTRSFEFFFDLRLNKRLSKQSIRRWFQTPSRSLWRHCIEWAPRGLFYDGSWFTDPWEIWQYFPKCNFKPIFHNDVLSAPREIALPWMTQDLIDDKSTLVQEMAWCRQATSHYQSQCWSNPMASQGHNELTQA